MPHGTIRSNACRSQLPLTAKPCMVTPAQYHAASRSAKMRAAAANPRNVATSAMAAASTVNAVAVARQPSSEAGRATGAGRPPDFDPFGRSCWRANARWPTPDPGARAPGARSGRAGCARPGQPRSPLPSRYVLQGARRTRRKWQAQRSTAPIDRLRPLERSPRPCRSRADRGSRRPLPRAR